MKKLRIGIIDLVSRGATRAWFARVMNANLASIMPQVVGVWCRQEGHDVSFICYTGFENLQADLPDKVDLVFIGAFTEAAQTAYALSNLLRATKGAVTALGGPHARCYPQDALRYFDYVLGFTDRGLYHDPYAYLESQRSRSPSLHETVLASTPSANGASDATIRTSSVCSPSASDGDLAGGSNELAGVETADGQLGVRNEIQGNRHVGI
jgi:hypothetical protein